MAHLTIRVQHTWDHLASTSPLREERASASPPHYPRLKRADLQSWVAARLKKKVGLLTVGRIINEPLDGAINDQTKKNANLSTQLLSPTFWHLSIVKRPLASSRMTCCKQRKTSLLGRMTSHCRGSSGDMVSCCARCMMALIRQTCAKISRLFRAKGCR